MFVSIDASPACSRDVIESTTDAYSRGTDSNPVEGNGQVFPSYRQLHLSSFSDTHTHTHTHTRTHTGAHSCTHLHTHNKSHKHTLTRNGSCFQRLGKSHLQQHTNSAVKQNKGNIKTFKMKREFYKTRASVFVHSCLCMNVRSTIAV